MWFNAWARNHVCFSLSSKWSIIRWGNKRVVECRGKRSQCEKIARAEGAEMMEGVLAEGCHVQR